MNVARVIALRYLFSRERLGFVNAISIISIVGVTIGVAALIVVLSVFNGFNGLVTSILVNFDPHVRVERPIRGDAGSYEEVQEFLSQERDVAVFAPYVSGKALIVSKNVNRVVNIKGIDAEKTRRATGLADRIVLGALSFEDRNVNGIVLGLTLADRLGSVVGDTLVMVSPAGSEPALLQMGQPLIRKFIVAGIYESNNKEYDGYYAYVSLPIAQEFFKLGEKIHGFEIRLRRFEDSYAFKETLTERFGDAYRVLSWYDLHRDLFTVMQIERWIAYLILSLIVGVASFNLLGSLTMSVIEKTRDIGVLRAMGTTRQTVTLVFMLQGVFVGILGAATGLTLGMGLLYLQREYHLFPLDPSVYIIPAIPVQIVWSDILLVTATALVFCSLAAWYPARRAATLIPAEAIRWE
ncbi:MAG: FtsX-like permease family protein [Ignavibacteria bacterium]|nr:FtsX-like permease family protein [Ignavibacteria bacterium]